MDNLGDIVYALTPSGVDAFNHLAGNLAKDLRSILSMVDGVTPVAQFEPFLQAFMPLEVKFLALERAGFIRRLGKVSAQSVSRFRDESNSGFHVSKLSRIDAEFPDSGYVAT